MDYILQNNIFKNPHKLPLNELNLEIKTIKKIKKTPKEQDLEKQSGDLAKNYDVRVEKIKALDKTWVQKNRTYHLYQAYYTDVSAKENESFVIKNKDFLDTINFLLQCTYQQFWCHMAFEPKVVLVLKSFVYNAVPWYEIKSLDENSLEMYSDIYDKVAQVFSRILTYHQSNAEHMSESTVAHVLDSNELITFPMIMQLCLLYKSTNQSLINDLMQFYYSGAKLDVRKEDIKKMLDHALLVLEMVGGQICGFEKNTVVMPICVGAKPKQFDPYWYENVTMFLLDTAANLNAFLSACTLAVGMAREMGLPYRLTFFYNQVYSEMYKMLDIKRDMPFDWSPLKTRIYDHMAAGRSEFVNCFHIFVSTTIDQIVQSQGDLKKQDEHLEEYIKLITGALEDEYFIFDYHNANEIDLQLQMINDFYPELDTMRTEYIIECLSTLPKLQEVLTERKEINELQVASVSCTSEAQFEPVQEKENENISEDEIEERIRDVLDMLPYLGDGFILKCLEVYNYNPSEVISAILDENLPPHLEHIPRDLIRVPPEPAPEQPILAYKGKKPTYNDAKELLDERPEHIRDFVLKASNYDMYDDDDYDDRYEEEAKYEKESKEEANPYKYMENRFDGYEMVSDPSDSEEEETVAKAGPSTSRTGGKSVNFCEDPALLRERREAFRGRGGRGRDVVGKPKGQGQDKSVLNNRDKKNVNKSSRANHNRKSGAQWKHNRGMMPF